MTMMELMVDGVSTQTLYDDSARVSVEFEQPDECEDEDTAGQPEPLSWCKVAAIAVDGSQDSVTVSISIGPDPRGTYMLNITRMPDDAQTRELSPDLAGRLVMTVPNAAVRESMMQAPLRELRPGTLVIG
jgi:hypothetical protein